MTNEHRTFTFVADDAAAGERVDRYLAAQLPEASRAQIQRAAEAGALTVDGTSVKPSHRLKEGSTIAIALVKLIWLVIMPIGVKVRRP